ncbi:MAG: carbohydrate ABC transporter permease [Spirochaetaceae bacterium]|jgi:raffinose/stachyose/melibiose transport system permease protein|nr:carbohydrate ABC transporter permease [Spirochaetaceae bacterium]
MNGGQERQRVKKGNLIIVLILCVVSILFLFPILLVFINSFKFKLDVINTPFALPNAVSFAGLSNYTSGLSATGFFRAAGFSVFITVFSVALIVLFSSMTAWFITRSRSVLCRTLYFVFTFAMIVPFQMVMFPLTVVANLLHLDNPVGILFIYLGFGAGTSVFLYSGFIKSIPVAVEEAAVIDGCTPIRAFFSVVLPMLTPISITVAILNTMWIWNDYLLPNLIIGSEYRTIPVAVQYLRGGYGSIDMGYMMAVITMALVPIIIFYFFCQKHIIRGVTAGSVKG